VGQCFEPCLRQVSSEGAETSRHCLFVEAAQALLCLGLFFSDLGACTKLCLV
jgi:hypothetical protein